jgi:hypothetical protein
MIKSIFTLILCSFFTSAAFTQWVQPYGIIKNAGDVFPVIDGVKTNSAEYHNANVYNIDRPFALDAPLVPTLGMSGETNWRAVYSRASGKAGIYILVTVTDDIYLPQYVNGSGDSYQFDKIELYFDCNYDKDDGMGGQSNNLATGHGQVAPDYTAVAEGGTPNAFGDPLGIQGTWAFKLNNPNVTAEYFIPFSSLKTSKDKVLDLCGGMGFDVTVVDRDDAVTEDHRKRMVWSNDATGSVADESWNNMDEAGFVQFDLPSGGCSYPLAIFLEPGAITENNGTLQLVPRFDPDYTQNKEVIYKLTNGTGTATITAEGLITARTDGTVSVTAQSIVYPYNESDPVEITISNQIVTMYDISLIPNGDFNDVTPGGQAENWFEVRTYMGPLHQVVEGVSVHNVVLNQDDPQFWRYQFANSDFVTEPNVDYELDFKSWADVETMIKLKFEDIDQNNYNCYGASTDLTAKNGRAEWDLPLILEPTHFKLNVNFDQKVSTTVDKFAFMLGASASPIYIDSVFLYKEEDLAKLTTEYIPVNFITITPNDLQMSAEVLPVKATVGDVRWSIIPGTGAATIDANGKVSEITAGTVTVVATAKDDSHVKGMLEITVDDAVGLMSHHLDQLVVHPTVTNGAINIETAFPNSVATIYNTLGRKAGQVVTGKNIDVSFLAKGVYFVRVNNTVARFIMH